MREPGRFSPFRIGVAVVLVAAALVAWSLTGNAATTYRTAVVGTATVQATLDSVGTVTPVNQARLNFNASGTVSAVDVSVGQQVASGQTLASLNIATLDAAVTSATAALAAAQATLASAEASQTQASTAVSSPAPSTTPTTPAPSSASAAQSAQGTKKITQLQSALTTAQNQVDAASAQATAALTAATAPCEAPPAGTSATSTTTTSLPSGTAVSPAPALSPPASAPSGGQSGTTPGAGGTPTGGGAAPTGGGAVPATCSQALSQASSAQASVASDLKKVAQAEAALNAALGSGASSSAASSGSSPAGGSGSVGTSGSPGTTKAATPAAPASASTASTSGSGSSRKASPQQLVVDQASIDTAQANLNAAEQAVTGVNLVSSIAGTVASVSISDGVSVTAGGSQSTPEIVVIGSGSAYRVSTAIPVADIGKVAVGQEAVVTPDSTGTVMTGRVASIGVLATSGTTSTTYPVTISLDAPDLGQLSGADAGVSIVVKRSVDVTAVPTSAVHAAGTRHIVDVVVGGTIKPVLVSVGTVGDTLTEVTSGISPGQVVSLADLGAPLPSASVTTRTGVGGLGGGSGLGGGGFGGAGGFPGGGGARPAG